MEGIFSYLDLETVKDTFNMIVNIVLMSIIVATGTLGNSVSFVVLLRDKQRRATHLILSSLALFDTVFLLTSYCFQSVPEYINRQNHPIGYRIYAYSGPYIYTLGHATRMMRNWTVVLVSVERFIAVSLPLRAATICTLRNGRRAIASIIGVCALYNVARFFEMHIEDKTGCFDEFGHEIDTSLSINSSTSNISMLNISCYPYISTEHSNLSKNPVYQHVYKYAGFFIFVIAGPVLLLSVLNTLLVVIIKRSNRSLHEMAAKSGSISSQGFTRTDSNRAGTSSSTRGSNAPLGRKVSTASQQSSIYLKQGSAAHNSMNFAMQTGVGHAIVARSSSSVSAANANAAASPAHRLNRKNSSLARKSSQTKTRGATARTEQMTSELTRICIIIILCYTLCELPPLAYQIVSPLEFGGSNVLSNIKRPYLQSLSVLFATLNSSALFSLLNCDN